MKNLISGQPTAFDGARLKQLQDAHHLFCALSAHGALNGKDPSILPYPSQHSTHPDTAT